METAIAIRRRVSRLLCVAAAATLGAAIPASVAANTLNVGGGPVSGVVTYSALEPGATLCGPSQTFSLSLSSTESVLISLGGAVYQGPLSISAQGTTRCVRTVERGAVSSATVSGTNALGATLSCAATAGQYLRPAAVFDMQLSTQCAIDGAAVVGVTTFQIEGYWTPLPTAGAATGFQGIDVNAVATVLPNPSTGLGVGPPVVTGISPSQGSSAGGTVVRISGAGFADGAGSRVTQLAFGSYLIPAGGYTVPDDNTIVVTTPAEPAGAVAVHVTTDGGTAQNAPSYTFLPPPSVSTVSPSSGPGGQELTVTGSGFFGGQSSDQTQSIVFQCVGCSAAFWVGCWTTLSDTSIDIPWYCAPDPSSSTVAPKTVFDVVVTTSVGSSAISSGDHWTYDPGNGHLGVFGLLSIRSS